MTLCDLSDVNRSNSQAKDEQACIACVETSDEQGRHEAVSSARQHTSKIEKGVRAGGRSTLWSLVLQLDALSRSPPQHVGLCFIGEI